MNASREILQRNRQECIRMYTTQVPTRYKKRAAWKVANIFRLYQRATDVFACQRKWRWS